MSEPLGAPVRVSIAKAVAVLCLDCEHLYEADPVGCPRCRSQASHPLARWLDRNPAGTGDGPPPYHATDEAELEADRALAGAYLTDRDTGDEA